MKTILLLALAAAIPVSAQIGNGTVAGLPAASGYTGKVTVLTDCTTAYDCSVGGGAAFAAVRSTGSAWVIAFFPFATLPVAVGGTGLTTLTANTIYKGNGTSAIAASSITDDGTTVATTEKLNAIPGGTVSALKSYSYTYTNAAFIVASTTATITVATLPANTIVKDAYIKHSTAFAGAGITAATCSLGVSGDTDFYLSPGDVFTAATATLSYSQGGTRPYSTASHDLLLTCVSNTNWGNGSATVATAGALTVVVAYSTIQ